MATLVSVAKIDQLKDREGLVVTVEDDEIALFKVDGSVYAVTNTCPHRGGPIGEGSLEGAVVTCPWHGWEFDVTSGRMTVNRNIGIRTYRVEVQGEDVKVEV